MTTFSPGRDKERKEKLNMRSLKTLVTEVDFYKTKFRGANFELRNSSKYWYDKYKDAA